MSAGCRASTVRVSELSEPTVDEMWKIFHRYYEAEDKDAFVASLREKDVAFLVEDRRTRRLVGFTSALVLSFAGYRVVHSGDTIIERDYWGAGKHLGYQMVKLLTRLSLSRPRTPLYWFLISKGYKTYLLMARNMNEFYPTWRTPTPPWAGRIIEEVARHRYGTAFRPETGVLTFPYRRKPLLPWVAPITDEDRENPDIAYFLRANPRWSDGDELVCLGVVNCRQLVRGWLKFTRAV